MSLLNLWCSPKRAIVAVDTLGGAPGDEARLELSKLFYLPHLNVVIAGRGFLGIAQFVFNECLQRQGDFDAFEEELPDMCRRGREWLISTASEKGVQLPLDARSMEVAFVGWSERAKSMRALHCHRLPNEHTFTSSLADPYVLAPGEPWAPTCPPAPDSADKMFAYGQRQARWWHENLPGLPTGGRLVIAEVTRYTMNVASRALPTL